VSKSGKPDKVTVDREEYEFLEAIVEAVDDYLNAPFPRLREETLEWLTDTLGDDLGDEDPKLRDARLEEADCENCRKMLVQAYAWKKRKRHIEPAPVLTLHRHGEKLN
jgi:hypothetical protein